jgi:hypothetical protein
MIRHVTDWVNGKMIKLRDLDVQFMYLKSIMNIMLEISSKERLKVKGN